MDRQPQGLLTEVAPPDGRQLNHSPETERGPFPSPRRRSRLARTGRVCGVCVSGAALVLMGFVSVGPHLGKYRTLTVLSGSMRPTAPEGALLIVRPVAPADLRVGDVITYQIPVEDRRIVSHRIVEILEPGNHPVVRTKGDANTAADPWVARLDSAPAWRAATAVPYLGYAINALRRSLARPAVFHLVLLMLAVVWLKDIWSDGKGDARQGTGELRRRQPGRQP